ncbi:MAG TPA: class F sortase [Marmoricola sp.]|nr:class F sortase [Marmoricola sp.]
MTDGRAGDRIAGTSTRLFVLFLAMVIVGFVIPSPGIATNPRTGTGTPLYLPLDKPANPELLIIRDIGVRAPVVPIEISSAGVLSPPDVVKEVGWWKRSAKPGSPTGQTLITGHTVHTGGGSMDRLGEVRPGALIQIRTPRGTIDYEATKVFVYTRAKLAEHARDLFSQKRSHNRLVLVTCTGWTGHDYTSNIIVFANPLGVRQGPEPQES